MSQVDAAPGHGAASDSPAGRRAGMPGLPDGPGQPADAGRRPGAENLDRGTIVARELETADGLWGKFLGLMGRETLPEGHGLWLPESNGIHMMFMRFPIDAVFVGRPDADGTRPVVSVHRSLAAWRGLVPLVRGAHGVLELPVGTIDATRTAVGDRLLIG